MTAGLLDASVVLDWHRPEVAAALPEEVAVAAVTLAELAAGPHLAATAVGRTRRQARLQQVEAAFAPLPFTAATAHAHGLALDTRNGDDLIGVEELLPVVRV